MLSQRQHTVTSHSAAFQIDKEMQSPFGYMFGQAQSPVVLFFANAPPAIARDRGIDGALPHRCQRPECGHSDGGSAVAEADVRRYLLMQGHEYVSYEEFGRRFFEVAVTAERVGAAFAAIAGSQFDMEPMAQGPGKIAKVSAKVTIKVSHRCEPRGNLSIDDGIDRDFVTVRGIAKRRFGPGPP